MTKVEKDDYVLVTPCCNTSSISCYVLADLNSINASHIEPLDTKIPLVFDTIELIESDKKLLETELKWEG